MTDEEEGEFNDQMSKTKYAWERDLVRRQQNQLMRQRARISSLLAGHGRGPSLVVLAFRLL
jgi:hypothetical protein